MIKDLETSFFSIMKGPLSFNLCLGSQGKGEMRENCPHLMARRRYLLPPEHMKRTGFFFYLIDNTKLTIPKIIKIKTLGI